MNRTADQAWLNATGDLTASQCGREFRLETSDDYGDAKFTAGPGTARGLRDWLSRYLEAVGEDKPVGETP